MKSLSEIRAANKAPAIPAPTLQVQVDNALKVALASLEDVLLFTDLPRLQRANIKNVDIPIIKRALARLRFETL